MLDLYLSVDDARQEKRTKLKHLTQKFSTRARQLSGIRIESETIKIFFVIGGGKRDGDGVSWRFLKGSLVNVVIEIKIKLSMSEL